MSWHRAYWSNLCSELEGPTPYLGDRMGYQPINVTPLQPHPFPAIPWPNHSRHLQRGWIPTFLFFFRLLSPPSSHRDNCMSFGVWFQIYGVK
ncbi:hypothetical protein BO71DRAFT_151782 [Aspergillus ellipticus CBS 707.79]|uniref:Uncharacterized protein n=1 Tax=Aspergillus ellipticus CBS 707.79 TaxID=1448320 RepID=A0A319DSC7_9EURO|nr:hypothetical protein BO71DRAFT_151782 [Aspergillus ellipticus CBS 707.79]